MKPIKFHISRHGLNVVGKFARWYHYTLFDSRRYTEDLTPKWNNLSDFFLPIDNVEQYGIGIKEPLSIFFQAVFWGRSTQPNA